MTARIVRLEDLKTVRISRTCPEQEWLKERWDRPTDNAGRTVDARTDAGNVFTPSVPSGWLLAIVPG